MVHTFHMHRHRLRPIFAAMPPSLAKQEEHNRDPSHDNRNDAESLICPFPGQPHDHLDNHQGDHTGTRDPEARGGCQSGECSGWRIGVEEVRDERDENGHVAPDVDRCGDDGDGMVEVGSGSVGDPEEGDDEQDAAYHGGDESVFDAWTCRHPGLVGALG